MFVGGRGDRGDLDVKRSRNGRGTGSGGPVRLKKRFCRSRLERQPRLQRNGDEKRRWENRVVAWRVNCM